MLKAMFNGGEESKARMEGGGHDKEVASSKFNTSIQKSIPYLWPKRLKNPTLWGRTYLYSPYKEVPHGALFPWLKPPLTCGERYSLHGGRTYLNFIWSWTYLILFFLIDLCTKVTSDCQQFCFMSTFLLSIVFSAVFHNQSPWCAC